MSMLVQMMDEGWEIFLTFTKANEEEKEEKKKKEKNTSWNIIKGCNSNMFKSKKLWTTVVGEKFPMKETHCLASFFVNWSSILLTKYQT